MTQLRIDIKIQFVINILSESYRHSLMDYENNRTIEYKNFQSSAMIDHELDISRHIMSKFLQRFDDRKSLISWRIMKKVCYE